MHSAGTGVSDAETSQAIRIVSREAVEVAADSGQSSDDFGIIGYCGDKVRFLSEDEMQTLADMSEESIAHTLGGPCSSGGFTVAPLGGKIARHQAVEEHVLFSSTPVKLPSAAIGKYPARRVICCETKQSVGVAFAIDE